MPATELNVGVCSEEKCNSNIKKYPKMYANVGV
jgi:hypothetical protein